jgi:hypothetical protein
MENSAKNPSRIGPLWFLPLLGISIWGCISPGTGTGSFGTTAGASLLAIAPGPMSAKVIFTDSSASGSFAAPPVGGTLPAVGSGLHATQLFTPANAVLATGNTSANWPAWLNYVEIGISGATNTSAPNPFCATFATQTPTCNFGPINTAAPCEAPLGTFRISEFDCGFGAVPAALGNGGPADGVYIRANFNRANLGSTENIMVVIEYAASAYDAAPANPTTCVGLPGSPGFTPEACADFTWRLFLKSGATSVTQPFMMLVPPTYSFINGNTTSTSGTTSSTRQFILPIAANAALDTIQLSRTGSTLNSSTNAGFIAACNGAAAGTGANSPLCAGLIIYSMTFYRI